MIGMVMTVICATLVIGFQQKPYFETVNAQSGTPSLTVEVSTPKTDYLQIEPIPLNLRLSNQTNQSIPWKGVLIIGPNVNILTRNADGEEFRFEGNKYPSGLFGLSFKAMQPGEQIQGGGLLDSVLSELLFPRPGRYDLQVEFVYKTSEEDERQQVKITSNSISINISAPQGNDRRAYEFIKGRIESAYRQSVIRSRELAQIQQEFVDKYENTVYAKSKHTTVRRSLLKSKYDK